MITCTQKTKRLQLVARAIKGPSRGDVDTVDTAYGKARRSTLIGNLDSESQGVVDIQNLNRLGSTRHQDVVIASFAFARNVGLLVHTTDFDASKERLRLDEIVVVGVGVVGRFLLVGGGGSSTCDVGVGVLALWKMKEDGTW